MGNLFRTEERKDRKYGKGGRLLEDKKFSYHYDGEGNPVLKQRLRPDETLAPLWQEGDWAYEWQGNGMLRSVKRPDGETVSFEYDPLGRRISKTYKDKTTRWVWDGNVPLHEWTEEENVTTWLFEEGTFVPAAKIVGDKSYSIITDYLGTPTEMFNSDGEKTWSTELDIYGCVRNFAGRSLSDCPFRYQGQYEDEETGLYYNRFRYYDPSTGAFISKDPIGLAGNNPTLYAYVKDVNKATDVFGLYIYYQLKDSLGNIVYHGITDRPIQERLLERARDGKAFNQVSYVDNLSSRIEARNLEGSALHLDKGNSAIQNAVRKDGGFYHSYDPDNLASGRTFLTQAEIDTQMRNATTSNVDEKGKIKGSH